MQNCSRTLKEKHWSIQCLFQFYLYNVAISFWLIFRQQLSYPWMRHHALLCCFIIMDVLWQNKVQIWGFFSHFFVLLVCSKDVFILFFSHADSLFLHNCGSRQSYYLGGNPYVLAVHVLWANALPLFSFLFRRRRQKSIFNPTILPKDISFWKTA